MSYGAPKLINTLYQYKLNDELVQIDVASEVCREYHNGKFDPVAHSMLPKRKNLRGK